MRRELFIDGKWQPAGDGRRVDISDPATGQPVGLSALAGRQDVDGAVAAATRALPAWSAMHADERAKVLHRAADLVVQRVDAIAETLTREQGKPIPDSRKEILFGVEVIRFYAEEGRRLGGSIRPASRADIRNLITTSPVGVVAGIIPWNYPVDLYCWKVAPALAAGCTLVAKPPHETPLAIGMVVDCFAEAGLPAGVLNDIPGTGPEVGAALAAHDGVRMITATASVAAGQSIMRAAAGNLKRLSLELGGQCPFIVLDDANIEDAAAAAARRSFSNMGQICIAVNRILVSSAVHDRFVEALVAETRQIRLGHGVEPGVLYGPPVMLCEIVRTTNELIADDMGDIPRISRQFSQRSVMETIVQGGPISRASIAKQTGLSKQTISEIVRGLEQEGWIQETGRTSGHVGRTAVTYELVNDAAYIVAVDLGGTKVRVALTDLACRIFAEETASTDARGGKFLVDEIVALAFQAAARQRIARKKIRLAVIGVPGVPDQRTGRVLLAPNIGGFDEIDVVEAFARAFGFGVLIENDVNLAVLGENWMGKGQGIDNLAYIALGTGIGCGIMLDGHLVRGATNAAGEMGFLPIGADAYQTESLRAGALERAVAAHAIIDRYAAMTRKRVSVPAIFQKAEAGEPAALSVLDSIARYLAQGIAALAAIVNPEKVILGGSIGLRPEILSRVQALLPQCFPYELTVEASELGSRATIIGAAAIGLSQLHNTLFGVDAPDGRLSLPPANAGLLREAAL